jgi:hypothetical protein
MSAGGFCPWSGSHKGAATVQGDSYFEHESGRVRATPAGIAASLAEGIIRGTNSLRARLEEQGFPSSDPKRFNSEACVLECVLFEWFLRDLLISAEFGRHTNAIRKALTGRLLIDLQRSGLSPACLMDVDQRHRQRFSEYAQALEASSSLQALGALAWLRILGSDEPSDRMTMLFGVRATANLRALQGMARRYTVISPILARFRAAHETGGEAYREL